MGWRPLRQRSAPCSPLERGTDGQVFPPGPGFLRQSPAGCCSQQFPQGQMLDGSALNAAEPPQGSQTHTQGRTPLPTPVSRVPGDVRGVPTALACTSCHVHQNLESSACQTARMGRGQRDGSLQPGRQMPGGLQLFWASSCSCFLTQVLPVPTAPGEQGDPHPLSNSLQMEYPRPETSEAGSQAKGNQPLTKQT